MIDACIDILRHTNDGNDLEPTHLSLVEMAANNRLNEAGHAALHNLHEEVMAGRYAKPWLCSVEHVTRDHGGNVFWKGIPIEHFSFHIMSRERLEACTQRLAAKCRHLEVLGLPVSSSSYLNNWLDEMPLDFPQAYKKLLFRLQSIYEHEDGRAIFNISGPCDEWGWPTEARYLEVKDRRITQHCLPIDTGTGSVPYHALTQRGGFRLARCGQPEFVGPAAINLAGVMDWLQRHGITEDIARRLVEADKANDLKLRSSPILLRSGLDTVGEVS